jgi:peptidoglycan/xylan/chitin deacetylase (PgdA/CDA1 family)
LATLYFFHPLRRWIGASGGKIGILMYHSVSRMDESGRHPYYRTSTAPEVFTRHLEILRLHKFNVINLHEAVNRLFGPCRSDETCVVITFDDGYEDFYTTAFPILNKFQMTATVFLPTGYIGHDNRPLHGLKCLSWSEVRELRAAGIEFGSHTVTHPKLKTLELKSVHEELQTSKKMIEDEIGETINSFSYPFAFPETDTQFRRDLRSLLEESGYSNGVSTIIGMADVSNDRYFLNRLPINSWDDSRLFQAKLEGGYGWLHGLQYLSKWGGRWRKDSNIAASSQII